MLALALPLFSGEAIKERGASNRIESGEPVLEYWDGGIFHAGVKPFPIIVVWPDGTIIKRVNDRLLMGTVSQDSVKALLGRVRAVGFFTNSRSYVLNTYGMVYVDGPVKCLVVSDGTARRMLFYHGRDEFDRFDQIGPRADPSRAECQAFVAIWKRTVAVVGQVDPAGMKPFDGQRPIRYPDEPQKRDKSAADGKRR